MNRYESKDPRTAGRTGPALEDAFGLIGRIVSADVAEGFPAAQLAVMRHGRLICSRSWGGATEDTLFDLASNTKMYTAAYAVQYLVTRGRLSPDTRITEILGSRFADDTADIAYANGTPSSAEQNKAWKRSLTVRDVMSHRAGFPANSWYYCRHYDFGLQKLAGEDAVNPLFCGYDGSPETRRATLDAICRTPLMYEPRTQILYSDADYMLLCFVIEAIVRKPLDIWLRETFWQPMGLERVTFKPLEHGFLPEDCAPTELHGNTRDGAVMWEGIRTYPLRGEVHDEKAWYLMGGVSGHAGLFANAKDLARLASLMLDGTDRGIRYFDPAVIALFTAPVDPENDQWGIGWMRQGDLKRVKYFGTLCPDSVFGHQGWTGTLTVIDRAEELVIAFLTDKIATPVTDPTENPDMFDGNHYTAASLGFVTQLIYDALRGVPFDADLDALVLKMRDQAQSDPCPASDAALRAVLSVRNGRP